MRYGIEVVPFGESGDARTRAAKLDEALTILARLWSGEPVTYHGQHDTLEDHLQSPRSIQKPRIPVWIGGESIPALRRAARWDGWIMGTIDENCNIVKTPQESPRKSTTSENNAPLTHPLKSPSMELPRREIQACRKSMPMLARHGGLNHYLD